MGNLGFCNTKFQPRVSDDDLDMDQHRIKDMGPPVDTTDAVTKGYVDTNYLNRNGRGSFRTSQSE